VALKKTLQRLRAPVKELDGERLREFCSAHPTATAINDLQAREEATVIGEITSLRIVPQRDGSPWLEATISDGTGSLIAMWTGRRRIAGVRPGQRLLIMGRGSGSGTGGRLMMLNPAYELL
jgi:hypothetical protein